MNKIQYRTVPLGQSGLHVRQAATGSESRTLEGHAVVFGVRSLNLMSRSDKRVVYEVMEPGCITPELLRQSDVVLTAFHDNHIILGRWRRGIGTLSLSIDNRGLKAVCTLAETPTASELLTSIKRGDISGMSFAYITDEDDKNAVSYERLSHSQDGKEVWLRHVKKVTGLFDVTIAGHPAYPQTDVGTRQEIDKILDGKTGNNPDELAAKLAKLDEDARRGRERRAQIRRRMEMMHRFFLEF